MKQENLYVKNIRTIIAAIFLLGGISVANAQLDRNAEIKTDVPFEFVVGETLMPAGEYTISRLPTGSELVIRNRKGDAVIVDTLPSALAQTAQSTSVDFETVDGVHILKRIRVSGSDSASELRSWSRNRHVFAKKRGGTDTGPAR